jgi:alpha-glucuronidase
MIEFQIIQENSGQSKHLIYLFWEKSCKCGNINWSVNLSTKVICNSVVSMIGYENNWCGH